MRFCLLVVSWLGVVSVAQAIDLKPIEQVLNEEQSLATTSYALKRCSAAYLALSGLLMSDQSTMALSASADEMSMFFFGLAEQHAKRFEVPFEAQGTMDLIGTIVGMYGDEMMANFAATGNRMEGVIAADITFCKGIYDEAQQG